MSTHTAVCSRFCVTNPDVRLSFPGHLTCPAATLPNLPTASRWSSPRLTTPATPRRAARAVTRVILSSSAVTGSNATSRVFLSHMAVSSLRATVPRARVGCLHHILRPRRSASRTMAHRPTGISSQDMSRLSRSGAVATRGRSFVAHPNQHQHQHQRKHRLKLNPRLRLKRFLNVPQVRARAGAGAAARAIRRRCRSPRCTLRHPHGTSRRPKVEKIKRLELIEEEVLHRTV